jgi:uncharacterized protein DUF6519
LKGDFTRFTHKSQNHFNRVYKQQGRAELDADFNEYVDLATDLNRNEAVDIIGKVGAPKGSSFKVEVINNNTDLLIRKGHIYVDGILCALEDDILYRTQPGDLPQPSLSPALNRRDLVYLRVTERHITSVEDPSLLEPALQGADTCTRVKTVAQVRVQNNIPANSACGAIPNWPPAKSGGRLTTGSKAVGPAPNPCVLPESGGFSGTENRLYRVEIHTGGALNTATFKWSRDNSAVVVPVEFIGEVFRVKAKTLGHDQTLGLKKGDWVELASDTTDLTPLSGTLVQIEDITPDLIIQLSKNISAHNGQSNPKLRKWDQASDAVSMQNGATLDLEDGITIKFSGSNFLPGDAWMFTARIGSGVEQLVDVQPSAIIHHYAPLAIITWAADPNNAATLLGKVELCAPQFPPLTDITADDVKFNGSVCKFGPNVKTVQQAIDALCEREEDCCTIVVRPGPNWADVFNTIPAGGAHLCFQPNPDGYQLNKRVEIQNRGSIVISGVGDAAKIIANDDECALRFVNCNSVTIRDLFAQTKTPQIGSGRNKDGILGVIAFKGIGDVFIENCFLNSSAPGPHRTMAGLSVHGAVRAVIRDNYLVAGAQQVGLLLSDVRRSWVESNTVAGTPRGVGNVPELLKDPQYLAGVRTRLITNLSVGLPAPTNALVNVTDIAVGGQPVRFLAPDSHIQQWKNLLQQNPLPGNPSISNIEDHILGLANQILINNPFPSFSGIRATIFANTVPASQGITVGGTEAQSVVIANNLVTGFIQGIHVGLSTPSPNISIAERVQILENKVEVWLGTGATRGRHGIYVGNVASLSIRGNRLTLTRPSGTQNMQIDGIRVFGRMGRSIVIRENHLAGFNIGVRFELRGATPTAPMWLINDNLAEGSSIPVSAPNVANKTNNWG